MEYVYVTVENGIEALATSDEQMESCISNGGEIYSIDSVGNRVLIANGKFGFLFGRPGFPVFPESRQQEEKTYYDEYRALYEARLKLEEK